MTVKLLLRVGGCSSLEKLSTGNPNETAVSLGRPPFLFSHRDGETTRTVLAVHDMRRESPF